MWWRVSGNGWNSRIPCWWLPIAPKFAFIDPSWLLIPPFSVKFSSPMPSKWEKPTNPSVWSSHISRHITSRCSSNSSTRGQVGISCQSDIVPLREMCFSLGVASLMARLDELSLSLQCLPPNDDDYVGTNLSKTEVETAAANFDTTYLNDETNASAVPSPVTNASNVVQGRVKKKAFSCSKCSSKFYTQEALKAHERMHEEKKPFSCPE